MAKLLQNNTGKDVPVKPAKGNKVAPGGKNLEILLEALLKYLFYSFRIRNVFLKFLKN